MIKPDWSIFIATLIILAILGIAGSAFLAIIDVIGDLWRWAC